MSNYILEGHTTVECIDILEWGKWFSKADTDRKVSNTENGDIRVSTVFLGIDHSMREHGPPILFETMVFGGEKDQEMERYATWEQAEKGHEKMCNWVGIKE